MNKCRHFWVHRKDGYEEQCGPAICLICGKYGCMHDFEAEVKKLPNHLHDRRRSLFKSLGINGNDHKLERKLNAVLSK